MNTSVTPDAPRGLLTRLGRNGQIVLIILCLAAAAAVSWHAMQPAVANGQVPVDFPHTWLAPQDDGLPDKVVIIRGRNEPPAPVERDGRKLFQAFCCLNERCPGRVGGKPYVFAHWDMRPCPKCQNNDPRLLQRYETPEGEAAMAEIRRSFAP